MFIRENDSHSLRGQAFRYSNIAFSGAWMDALRGIAGNDLIDLLINRESGVPFVTVPQSERHELDKHIGKLRGVSRDKRTDLRFSFLLHYVMDRFLFEKETSFLDSSMPLWLGELVRSVSEDENFSLTVDQLVKKSCRCAEHVSRSFRKYLNTTPTAFIRNVKLDRASELLKSTNYPVKEICYLCSYENANYFHRQFREKYAMTPLQYRADQGRRIH